jgi:hypothetical protein
MKNAGTKKKMDRVENIAKCIGVAVLPSAALAAMLFGIHNMADMGITNQLNDECIRAQILKSADGRIVPDRKENAVKVKRAKEFYNGAMKDNGAYRIDGNDQVVRVRPNADSALKAAKQMVASECTCEK